MGIQAGRSHREGSLIKTADMRHFTHTLKRFGQKFNNDWSMNLASMLAYNLITTIFPILLAILSIAGIALQALSPGSFGNLVDKINTALPGNLAGVINANSLLHNLAHLTGPLAIVSFVGLVWSGSGLFGTMENAFSIIFRTSDRDFIPQKIMSVVMVIVLAILLPFSLAAASLVTAGSAAFRATLPQPFGVALSIVSPLTAVGILWVLFLLVYIVVPNIKVPFRDAWRGALIAAILSALFNLLFPLYFKLFLTGNARYGAAAATALLLVIWLWFLALITIIGAQVNAMVMGLNPTRLDLARTLCEDYRARESTATSGNVPAPDESHRQNQVPASERGLPAPSATNAPSNQVHRPSAIRDNHDVVG